MPLEQSRTNFRALQVLEDTDRASLALGGAPQASDVLRVILVRAVGKIEASDVHAEPKQVAHGGFRVPGRTDGADDFCPAGRRVVRGRSGDRF